MAESTPTPYTVSYSQACATISLKRKQRELVRNTLTQRRKLPAGSKPILNSGNRLLTWHRFRADSDWCGRPVGGALRDLRRSPLGNGGSTNHDTAKRWLVRKAVSVSASKPHQPACQQGMSLLALRTGEALSVRFTREKGEPLRLPACSIRTKGYTPWCCPCCRRCSGIRRGRCRRRSRPAWCHCAKWTRRYAERLLRRPLFSYY